jgi:hypothetical protein
MAWEFDGGNLDKGKPRWSAPGFCVMNSDANEGRGREIHFFRVTFMSTTVAHLPGSISN